MVWKVAFIDPADCSPSMMPPSGLPPLRQKSWNFAGAVKADAVSARISEAVADMSELSDVWRKGLTGVPFKPKSMDNYAIHQLFLLAYFGYIAPIPASSQQDSP
jgi:hypothetical protein